MRRAALVLSVPVMLVCAPYWASATEPEPALPAARLSATVGTVEYVGPGTDGRQPAPVNLALQPGDRLRTGAESRTEVQFEGGAVVRLGADSEAEILAVGRSPVVRLVAGRAYGRGPRVPQESLTLEAGLRIVAAAEGSAFRIEAGAAEPRAEVTATAGQVAVETEGERVELARGVRLPAGERSLAAAAVLVRDDFDRWNAERDAVLARAAVAAYAPAYVPGLAELEGAGAWVRTEAYGYAWRPHVAAGWRPFVDGRWVYRPYYGWVWLAPHPWGYTTYHYGRWVPSGVHGWLWVPGAVFGVRLTPHVSPPPVVLKPAPVVVHPRPIHVRPPVVVRPPRVTPPRAPHVRPPAVIQHPVPRRQPLPAAVERPAPRAYAPAPSMGASVSPRRQPLPLR